VSKIESPLLCTLYAMFLNKTCSVIFDIGSKVTLDVVLSERDRMFDVACWEGVAVRLDVEDLR